ncbi:ANTAR domain-containing protein [Egicoccus sp. AB-alg6-2]|uniref:ANTAR domain-containing protein n=1 Tax=Egicoccus sp. AB-alg6-2 TaxID=3242692 RepID=UPI00359DEED7
MKAALIEAGLETALKSRDVIGQAKGVLMARRRLTAEMAFESSNTFRNTTTAS